MNYSLLKQNKNILGRSSKVPNKTLISPKASEINDNSNLVKKNRIRTPSSKSNLNKKLTSQSTNNCCNYPVRKSVNLSNIDHFSFNNVYLSSNSRTITPTHHNKSTDRGIIGLNTNKKNNMKLNDSIKKRCNSKSACSNHIKQSILADKDNKLENKSKINNTLHRSSSTYGYISLQPNNNNKSNHNTSITIKVIESSTKAKKHNIPRSSKPSKQYNIPSSHQKGQNSVQMINQTNLLFNYKMNSTSCNSTGSSNVSNNTNLINKK